MFNKVDLNKVKGNTKEQKIISGGGWGLRQAVHNDGDNKISVYELPVKEYGTYKVTVKLQGKGLVRLFTNRRNLVSRDIKLIEGEDKTLTFAVNVTEYIPAITSIPYEDKSIYVSVCGDASVTEFEAISESVPVLYVAGDSTLTDQMSLAPYYQKNTCGGWAQMMEQYFSDVAVCNFAHSGLTTNCFKDDGHLDIVLKHIKPGDYFMLQFGHNDQKRRNLAAFSGYINNLRWYVSLIRKKGATPIICSPISRIPIDDEQYGTKVSLLSAHALACKQASIELNVPFIDLHELTFNQWLEFGDATPNYFMDATHTNDFGAQLIAEFVASELTKLNVEGLSDKVIPINLATEHPDENTPIAPAEPAKPGPFAEPIPYVDIKDDPLFPKLQEAYRGELLDPCIMHLHPNDDMPRAQLLMVLFKALRISGVRPYNGHYVDIARYEWDSSFVEACIVENLIGKAPWDISSDDRFRPDDPLTYGEFASFCIRGIQSDKSKRDIDWITCFNQAKEKHIIKSDAAANAPIRRAEVYAGLVEVMNLLNTKDMDLPEGMEIHPVS